MNDVTRNESGQFVKGESGNPKGRPRNVKNDITNLKQELELAVRRGVTTTDIQAIVKAMVEKAQDGSVQAAKLILDKTLSNAKEAEDLVEARGGIQVIVKNATLQVSTDANPPIEGELADE